MEPLLFLGSRKHTVDRVPSYESVVAIDGWQASIYVSNAQQASVSKESTTKSLWSQLCKAVIRTPG